MKKLITLLVAALSLSTLFPTTALAGSITDQFSDEKAWLSLGTSTSGNKIYIRIDDVAAGRSYSRDAKVWWGLDLSKNAQVRMRAYMMLVSYDCVSRTSQVVQAVAYYPNGTNHTDTSYNAKQYIAPGTYEDTVFKLTCMDPED